MSVVLPEPMSPVITTKPSASQIVDSMYAFARACCLLANRNCGSGVSRNGGSVSWNSSQYIQIRGVQPLEGRWRLPQRVWCFEGSNHWFDPKTTSFNGSRRSSSRVRVASTSVQ